MDPTSPTPDSAPQSLEQSNGAPSQPGAATETGRRDDSGAPRSPAAHPLQAAFRERFETLLPRIQRQWPEVARHTLEATRGSFDTAVEVISRQTGLTTAGVKQQLLDLLHSTGEQAHQVADSLRPLEEQLEQLLDDLNTTLRPRIEKPVREKPLLALGIAAGVGLVLGMLLSGRRSA